MNDFQKTCMEMTIDIREVVCAFGRIIGYELNMGCTHLLGASCGFVFKTTESILESGRKQDGATSVWTR